MKNFLKYTISAVFGISAVAKLIDFENTTAYFASFAKLDFKTIRYLLAVIILIELILAYLIPINWRGTRMVHNATMFILILFLGISVTMALMDLENCGCFGTCLTTSPLTSILKNLVLIVIMYVLKFSARDLRHA